MINSVDITSSVPVYVQIENHVRFAIAAGRLKPGDQLPSVRELSERLGVNPNTAAKAYRDLEVMGLLFTRRGMGVFVCKDVEEKCREECRRRITERMHEVISEAKAAGMNKSDIESIVEKCVLSAAEPYTDMPDDVLDPTKSE